MKEIGSEFEDGIVEYGTNNLRWFYEGNGYYYQYTISGRTAIQLAIEDSGISGKALLPSYCCDSMIEPFRANGFRIDYYSVDDRDGLHYEFPSIDSYQVVLFCNYFGFKTPYLPHEIVDNIHNNGGIIIEDFTHSLLSEEEVHSDSDYYIASLRKWFPINCGGVCVKKRDKFNVNYVQQPSSEFLNDRKRARILKKRYLVEKERSTSVKEKYLSLFSQTNRWIQNYYSHRTIDKESLAIITGLDQDIHRSVRRNNATILYERLRYLTIVKPLFLYEQMDCPLFVPVLIESKYRDILRKYLIDNAVYLPVHWPRPNNTCNSSLYTSEISLVCDQRYGKADMEHVVELIKRFEQETQKHNTTKGSS